jgi:hypothetical protein
VVVACIFLAVVVGTAIRVLAGTTPPLGRDELRRLQRISERRQREETLPFV